MPENKKPCPICKLDAQNVERVADHGERRTYNCARCGRYEITCTAEVMAESRQLGSASNFVPRSGGSSMRAWRPRWLE